MGSDARRTLYYCPKCQATLNPNVKIILSARKGTRQGLVLLSPRPGEYDAIAAEELALEPGDKVEFFCPLCRADLTSRADDNLAELGYRGDRGEEGRVDFSRIFGEHATYFVSKGEVRSFGAHASHYSDANFFGEWGDV
ncbi:MAG: hypothetical protein Kow0062_16150 [Acidobacteriota bacterium]|nr:MAG: hypothetical protein D6738_04115 [Acidobacteriota bacterium]